MLDPCWKALMLTQTILLDPLPDPRGWGLETPEPRAHLHKVWQRWAAQGTLKSLCSKSDHGHGCDLWEVLVLSSPAFFACRVQAWFTQTSKSGSGLHQYHLCQPCGHLEGQSI